MARDIVITDACIFIDLHQSDSLDPFVRLPYSITTTWDIWDELNEEHQQKLEPYHSGKQLYIQEPPEHFESMGNHLHQWEKLSIADRSCFSLALNVPGILLTSDGFLRSAGKAARIPTHGLLWIFEEMVHHKAMSAQEARVAGDIVFFNNEMYRNNTKLLSAWEEIKRGW